ncbi:GWxTD domain-containing protein [Balneolaceae bacterium YR4-1]|uniref:GWxTD domain-containing protein n=1 Tax=Halalkalibaculum roseum TaxID=2709311 RepID=A0A6M1SNQ8_9BACT|nr:GWxTD domain-containing protein [Halalkalibaculum roseum]NGP77011.1 GWxTD domain-containing protein [Halalkalibaculum roseum]
MTSKENIVNFARTILSFSMKKRKVAGIFILTFIPLHLVASSPQVDKEGYYNRGLIELEEGNFEEALQIWLEAKSNLEDSDFRISQTFIQLATKEKLEDYYTAASEIYYWGLSGKIVDSEKEALQNELTLLRPLLERKRFRNLEDRIENSDSGALKEIANYWNSLDPTPLTDYNERLIEHWQRINYARNHFVKANGEEFDDRADIYIKYGKPYYSKEGQLNYIPSFVTRILKEGIRPPSFGSAEQLAITSTQRMNLENRVRQYHEYNRYEVWIYRDLNEELQNTVFMFGTRNGTSSFRRIRSVDDFIPSGAYRSYLQHNYSFSGQGSGGGTGSGDSESNERSRQSVQFNNTSASQNSQVTLTPAIILQLMYYQQFAALDAYFGNAYDQMMDRFINVSNSFGTSFKGLAREFDTMHGTKLVAIQSRAPNEKTTLFENLIEMPAEYYTYRFLNEQSEPYSKVFTQITLDEAAYYDILRKTNSLQTQLADRYRLIGGYEIRDESGETLKSESIQRPVKSFQSIENRFNIPYEEGIEEILLSHELHSSDSLGVEKVASESPFPASLKGINNTRLDLGEPLPTEGLQLSDLIMGYSYQEDKDNEISRDSIDFTIAHKKVIPQGSDLSFYYELYNLLPKGTDEISEYSFEYSITKEKRGLFGRREDALLSIAINNTVIGDSDKNVIIIDTSNQEPGEYLLNISISDLNSDSTFTKTQPFSIE